MQSTEKKASILILTTREAKTFSKNDLSVHQDNLALGNEYNTASKVSSGVFDAIHPNMFEEPENFRQLLWNVAGPSSGFMIIMLDLLKDKLEAGQAGLPADFIRIPLKLLECVVQETGEECKEQIKFIKETMEDLKQLGQIDYLNETSSLEKGEGQS